MMVKGYGTAIPDSRVLYPETSVPPLNTDDMIKSYEKYRIDFDQIKLRLKYFDRSLTFKSMLDGYFSAIDSVLK